eukprot:gene11955-16002_t
MEQEIALREIFRGSSYENISKMNFVLENIADIEILAAADVFIGSLSNVYAMVASLRLSRYPERPLNNTCLIDFRSAHHPVLCEGYPAQIIYISRYGVHGNLLMDFQKLMM